MRWWSFILLFFCDLKSVTSQYGFYGNLNLQPQFPLPSYQQQNSPYISPSSSASSSSNPYHSNYDNPCLYGPCNNPSYLNSNYGGSSSAQELGSILGDISGAVIRSLGDLLLGSDYDSFPQYGYGPSESRVGRGQFKNQYNYGFNAGVYAGGFGRQSYRGPSGSSYGPQPNGPYNPQPNGPPPNGFGISGWPFIQLPTLPPLIPPLFPLFPQFRTTNLIPSTTTGAGSTTTVTNGSPVETTTVLQQPEVLEINPDSEPPVGTVVEIPLPLDD